MATDEDVTRLSKAMLAISLRQREIPTDDSTWDEKYPIVGNEKPATELHALYRATNVNKFPLLFERLLLLYRWRRLDLDVCRIHANPGKDTLADFLHEIYADACLKDYLYPRQLVPIGLGSDINYDPICIDASDPATPEWYPIIRLDHEDILTGSLHIQSSVIAKSFNDFAELILENPKVGESL